MTQAETSMARTEVRPFRIDRVLDSGVEAYCFTFG
jgi:hypothetical protein